MSTVSGPVQPSIHATDSRSKPRDYSRWRAATLIGVYVLMAVHVAHWKLNGRTLAPLELNELMYTLELGIVTAGFLFMCLALLSVLVFGRFFCSWGCHILALEDLCAWMLRKIGIRPKPVRSRALLLVPFGAFAYMFIWPQVKRVWNGDPLPRLHIAAAESWWGSFTTDDFWRNLPDVWIALLTFAVCGFLIIYVLGSRSFCKYVCPYGAVFSLADRVAPGRIVLRGDCTACGECTAVCTSHVRVHEEILRFGKVVNPQCLKDLDCVTSCPEGTLRFGFTKPSFFKSWKRKGRRIPRADFTWPEEFMIVAAFVIAVLVYRGLYMTLPFLLALGIGAVLAYGFVVCWRMWRRENVRLNNFQLRRAGVNTWSGWLFALFACGVYLLTLHSAFVRYHEWQGDRAFERVRVAVNDGQQVKAVRAAHEAVDHLSYCERVGLFKPVMRYRQLASLAEMGVAPDKAVGYLQEITTRDPGDVEAHLRLCAAYMRDGRLEDGFAEFVSSVKLLRESPDDGESLRARVETMRDSMVEALRQRGAEDLAERLLQLDS